MCNLSKKDQYVCQSNHRIAEAVTGILGGAQFSSCSFYHPRSSRCRFGHPREAADGAGNFPDSNGISDDFKRQNRSHHTEPVPLSEKTWKLGFTTGHGQKPRERSIAACNQARLLQEVAQAKKRWRVTDTAPVVSGYEAGREGCWLHRFLQAHGITNYIVESSSIEVNRRRR